METTVAPLFCDLETFSPVPINCGTHRYAEEAEVMLFAWAIGDGPISVWDLTTGEKMPDALKAALTDPQVLTVWHNGGMFDTVVLQHAMGIDIPLERQHDTLVQALAHGLPGSLGALCEVLNVPTDQAKDKAGKQLIQLFCKPRPKNSKIQRATRESHPVEWQRFVSTPVQISRQCGLSIAKCLAGISTPLKLNYGGWISGSTAAVCAWTLRWRKAHWLP